MGQRIIISEEDKNRIKGLYEQTSSKPFNFFTYKFMNICIYINYSK